MTAAKDKIRNVILCEDIREEAGSKKSLMGVMGGDILVATLPATLQIAVYFEYLPDGDEVDDLLLEVRLWQDEIEIAKAEMVSPIQKNQNVVVVLPRALVLFQKEETFQITIAVRGAAQFPILSKKIIKGAIS